MFFSAPLASTAQETSSSLGTVGTVSRTLPDGVTLDSITSVSSHESQLVILGLLFIVISLLCVFVFCFDMIVCSQCRQLKDKQKKAENMENSTSDPKIQAVFHGNPIFVI